MIVGAGEIGMPIIHYLSERGHILTVIENNEGRCKHISDHADAAIFQGSGSDTEIWKNTEADKMDALLALTNDDDVNLKVCEIAKKQFGIPFVIARAHQPENVDKMKEIGADIAICPALETRSLFLNALERLTAETLYENSTSKFKIVMATIPLNGSIIGKNVNELDLPGDCKLSSILRNGTVLFPQKSFVFKGGDKVLLLGVRNSVEKITEKLKAIEVT